MLAEMRFDAGQILRSNRTPEGFLEVYGRLVLADEAMVYRSLSGQTRKELIRVEDLFTEDSLKTFQHAPVTDEHPIGGAVTSTNWNSVAKGHGQPRFIKEETAMGTFLGQLITICDEALINKIEANGTLGLSPGYKAQTRQVGDSTFEQFDRQGNHIAVTAHPRGGENVRLVPEGFTSRTDSAEDELDLWYCHGALDDRYRCDVSDLVEEYMRGDRAQTGLIKKEVIKLSGRGFTPKSKSKSKDEDEWGENDMPEDHTDDGPCSCDACGPTKRKMKDSTLISDSIAESVVNALEAQKQRQDAEAQEAQRVDAVAAQQIQIANLTETVAKLADIIEGLAGDEEGEETPETSEVTGDSADCVTFDSVDDYLTSTAESIQNYLKIRTDCADLGLDLGETYTDSLDVIKAFVADPSGMRKAVLGKANPDFKTDSLEPVAVNAAYDLTIALLRKQSAEKPAAVAPRTDSYATALGTLTSVSNTTPKTAAPSLSAAFFETNGVTK